ncbi:uncharacterized protein CTRU02_213997 [Colletotrichum truncatum]|uniref:Uncharacterized protein n=1 Tax=Colletotrichum truncatum TaxID=5467 RepID=A0ACC3YJ89_COLTU|nr:uncharacterized protein CTRU02_06311 [Colletotrichum truncatum]KAF6792815.1 hypothetical protein CTRU02_06311 [Colletotrichum truncatum]
MTSSITTIARRADSLLPPLARAAHQLAVRDSSCEDGDNSPRCEKPYASSKIIGITIGVTMGVIVIGLGGVLTYLHMRKQRIDKKEDDIDFELDGDVDDHPTMGKPPATWQRNGQQRQENPFEPQPTQPQQNPFEPGRR